MVSFDITNMQPDFSSFTSVFSGVQVLGNWGLLPAFLSVVVMLLITRNVALWGVMWAPVLMLLKLIGMPISNILLLIAIIVFIGSMWKKTFGVSILTAARKVVLPTEKEEIEKLARDRRMLKLKDDESKMSKAKKKLRGLFSMPKGTRTGGGFR